MNQHASNLVDREAVKTLPSVRPVALRGRMHQTDRFQPENGDWFDVLTGRDDQGRTVGRDPMTIPLGVLTASGHPRRWCAAVLSAYRNGTGYVSDEGPKVRTYKELRDNPRRGKNPFA